MSESSSHPRPRQVTLAAWMIMGGSFLVVASVFERVAGLNTLETQQAIEEFLGEPPGSGLALDVEGVIGIIRAMAMVAAGCAAAAGVLGFHVLRRSRGARLGVTVLAAPLFVSGLVAGGFLSSLVAASAVLLWLEPSRDWFDGRSARERPEPERRPAGRHERPEGRSAPPGAPTGPPAVSGPRPHEGFGAVPTPSGPHGPTGPAWPGQQAPHGHGTQPPAPERPSSVLWACVLTWVFAGAAGLSMAALALVVVASPEMFLEELRRRDPELDTQGFSDAALRSAIYVSAGIIVAWSGVATVLAILLFRRVPWARLALAVCAAGAGAVCLLASVGSLVMVAPLLGSAVTFSLLLRREVRAWVAAP